MMMTRRGGGAGVPSGSGGFGASIDGTTRL